MSDIDFGRLDVTASTAENGDVRVNIGDALTNEGVAADAPFWTNGDGFLSRPNDPSQDGGGCCEVFYFFDGNQRIAVAARDGRYAEKAGALQPGDRAIVSRGEARFLLKAANDSVTLYTANQQDDDSSMIISAVGEAGVILIANGAAYLEMKKDKIVLNSGKSMLVLDSQGSASFFGAHFAANTKSGNLGLQGAVAPTPGVASILLGVSGMTGVPSAFWTIAVA
jgi:hypothetical protein